MSFEYPYFFLLLGVYVLNTIYFKQKSQQIYFSNMAMLSQASSKKNIVVKIVKFLIFFSLVVALSSPVTKEILILNDKKGYEISLILDASGSMSEDSKFDVTKDIVEKFIKKRPNDSFALSVFADFAYVAIPLTYDETGLLTLLRYIEVGVAGSRETALHEALYLSSELFKSTSAKNKIAILLTDGLDTTNSIPLEVAISRAKKYGVKVYTIGIGIKGDFNEDVLVRISKQTSGSYYHVEDIQKLGDIYNEIDNIEKSSIKTNKYTSISYYYEYPLIVGMVLLAMLMSYNFYNARTQNLKEIFSKFLYTKIIKGANFKTTILVLQSLALFMMFIALSRPSIAGDRLDTARNNKQVIVGLDLSKSMLCEDIYPSRLEFAKQKLSNLLMELKDVKVGILGFTNKAYLVSPMSGDYEVLDFLLHHLDTSTIDTKGSNIMEILKAVKELMGSRESKSIIVFTDGTDNNEFFKEIEYANKHNIKVFIYSVATQKGGVINTENGILKDSSGNIIITKLNSNIKQLAIGTDAKYIQHSLGLDDMKELSSIIQATTTKHTKDVMDDTELFYIPIAMAIVFFLI